jgi:hypothetical protein
MSATARNEIQTILVTVPALTHIAFITTKFAVRQAKAEYKAR